MADRNNQIWDLLLDFNDQSFFEFKKNEIKNKKLHNINLSLKTFTLPFLKLTGQTKRALQGYLKTQRSYLSYYNQNLFLITGTGILEIKTIISINN